MRMSVKNLLVVTAAIEIPAGVALLAIPGLLVPALLGAALGASAGVAVARLAGAALLALGVACGLGSRDPGTRAATAIVAGMLVYNLAAAVLLTSLRLGAGMNGKGLLPAVVLHLALAVWCIASLRSANPSRLRTGQA